MVSSKSPTSQQTNNGPWFAISMGLMGLIVGYSLAGNLPGLGGNGVPAPSQPQPKLGAEIVPTPPPPPAGEVPPVDAQVDHIRGNLKAKLSVIEYSDFQCPFCQRNHPTMQKILDTYGDDVNVVYRHFPLSFHENAHPAAVASECAAELGGNDGFWNFADAIFEGSFDYPAIAKKLGLDEGKFKDCIASDKFDDHIQSDMDGGSAAGVSGTPGNIILNNETKESAMVSGAQPFENFKAAIDKMLAE